MVFIAISEFLKTYRLGESKIGLSVIIWMRMSSMPLSSLSCRCGIINEASTEEQIKYLLSGKLIIIPVSVVAVVVKILI
jgi:hypothetical protein